MTNFHRWKAADENRFRLNSHCQRNDKNAIKRRSNVKSILHVYGCYDMMICDSLLVNVKWIAIIAINNRNALQKHWICVGWDNWLIAIPKTKKNKTRMKQLTEGTLSFVSSMLRSATHIKSSWALFTININIWTQTKIASSLSNYSD